MSCSGFSRRHALRVGWAVGAPVWTAFWTTAVSGATYHVDDHSTAIAPVGMTWADAFRDLQGALNVAVDGDEIWVAQGTYRPSINPDPGRKIGSPCSSSDPQLKTFLLVSGVAVLGGFPNGGGTLSQRDPATHSTILSGDLNLDDLPMPEGLLQCMGANTALQRGCAMWDVDADGSVYWSDFNTITRRSENARQVVTCWKTSDRTILDGFTVTGGTAVFCGNGQTGHEDAPTTTTNSASGGNPRYNIGGGLMNFEGSPLIRNCLFRDNVTGWRGGAIGSFGRSMTLFNCVFENNFANAEGGAIRQLSGGLLSIIDCLFVHNAASGSGGSVWIENADATVENCTIVENKAAFLSGNAGQGGAIAYAGPKHLTVVNSILWGNSDDGIELDESQILVDGNDTDIANNCIQHWPTTEFDNTSNDPMFRNAPAEDYHLLPNSGCIDTGDSARVPAEASIDLDGNARTYVLIVDRGVYESQDCNGNGILDALEPDADQDGVPNACDVCAGQDDRQDADRDGVPDGCDLCAGFNDRIDLNHDGIPDCSVVDLCPEDPDKTNPGACGCGLNDGDADGDSVPDCFKIDLCPNDPTKTTPGACGCGVAETDRNQDGVPDCFSVDLCPSDPAKSTPGACGCGFPDIDNDHNGVPDCFALDLCPADSAKTTPGVCGCGVSDLDDDHNGIPDCLAVDLCPADPSKASPGICGCGVPDQDLDQNGVPDCFLIDLCPSDSNKTTPGICGCGVSDVDNDHNGLPDCFAVDLCPADAFKTSPGICGCGVPDLDLDHNGVPDCFSVDLCPSDPTKSTPGACGCGVPDVDIDHNGIPDCFAVDLCPADPAKATPGICGCGVSDVDGDRNGVPDCFGLDFCPDDVAKTTPGVCGCGAADLDNDHNGIPDCFTLDLCPADPAKATAGVCGCGVPDLDLDGNGVPDCFSIDQCSADPLKSSPGVCGCNVADTDADKDGIPDCLHIDLCPNDPRKTLPGSCGCGNTDTPNCQVGASNLQPTNTGDDSASASPIPEGEGSPKLPPPRAVGFCGAGLASTLLPMLTGMVCLRCRRSFVRSGAGPRRRLRPIR